MKWALFKIVAAALVIAAMSALLKPSIGYTRAYIIAALLAVAVLQYMDFERELRQQRKKPPLD